MPSYEYECVSCAQFFGLVRRMNDRHDPADCPHCGGKGELRVTGAPNVNVKGGTPTHHHRSTR